MRERLGCGLLLCYLFTFLNSLVHLFVLSFTHPFSVISFNVCGEFSSCLLNIHVLFSISQILSRIVFLQYVCEQKWHVSCPGHLKTRVPSPSLLPSNLGS